VSFLHPLALLGLAAAAIPTLLHLLQRRTPPELEFPPLRYLSEAERQSARRVKLRHLLLLLLRTGLIVAVVLAAARPLVPLGGREGGIGGGAHEPTALVVILDNSPSSGTVVDGRPVLDRLRVAARASLARTTAADRVWLMLADGVVRGGGRDALLASADSATPDWRRLDLVRAVERAARLVHAEPLPEREVHVLSDLQRTALATGRAEVAQGVRVLALAPPEGGRSAANRGIANASVAEGAVVVTIAGSDGGEPTPVTVRVGARDAGRALATPGSGAAVSVALPPQPPGWWVGEAMLEPDELRADDRRPFVWRVAPPARVAAGPAAGPFVAAALTVLRDARRIGEGRDVVVVDVPGGGGGRWVVQPPADPALLGQANRALAARGVPWRWGIAGTPGPLAAPDLEQIAGVQVTRRYRLEAEGEGGDVLATVNGEPWLVRVEKVVLLGSRLDTAWTALPAAPGFVPFVDALVNRIVVGEAEVETAEGAPRVEFEVRGADTVGATVFGLDPRESDLTPATPELAAVAFGPGALMLDDARFAAERFAGTRRADASGILLAFALLLAAAEFGVARLTR
jgi:hypothetical protein